MSYDPYDDQDRRHRSDRHRESRRNRSNLVEEEVVEARGGSRPSRNTALVPRREDSSIEDVQREFPPGAGYSQRRSTGGRARSVGRSRYDDNDYYGDRGGKRHGDRGGRRPTRT